MPATDQVMTTQRAGTGPRTGVSGVAAIPGRVGGG